MNRLIPQCWLGPSQLLRVICHWTAGSYEPSPADVTHYHLLINGGGTVHRGRFSFEANVQLRPGCYAAHTRGLNTGSVGIAVCAMAGGIERPFKPGLFPMTKPQWGAMLQVAAELCSHYRLEVSERTVLGHGEVERIYGVRQRGKWDPMVLPWNPQLTKQEVGALLRQGVRDRLER